MTPEERVALKKELQKSVRSGRRAHFLYCMSGPERKPVLVLGRTRSAILGERNLLRKTAKQKTFLQGRVAVKADRSGYRFEVTENQARAIAGMRRDLRRVFGRASPKLRRSEVVLLTEPVEEEQPELAELESGEPEVDPRVLDISDVLDEDELAAIMEMPAPLALPPDRAEVRSGITGWVKRSGKAIGRGLKKAARATGRFLKRSAVAVKDFFQILGHTRLGLGSGIIVHTDLDEVMDCFAVVKGLSLDRGRSDNRVRMELHPMEGRTIITSDELAITSAEIGGVKTGPALLRGVRIELSQDEHGRPVQRITVAHLEADGIVLKDAGPLTVGRGVLEGLSVEITQTGLPLGETVPQRTTVSIARGSFREFARENEYLDMLDISDARMTLEDGASIAVAEADAEGVDLLAGTNDIHAARAHTTGLHIDQHGTVVRIDADAVDATEASLTGRPDPDAPETGPGPDLPELVRTGMARVAEADIHLSAPMVDEASLVGLRVRPGTELGADVAVSGGRLVPGETRVTFSEPLDGPAWVGLRGAYLDESGMLRADLAGFFDIGFGGHVNDALGLPGDRLPELARLGHAIAARMEAPPDPSGPTDNPLEAFRLDDLTTAGHLETSPGPLSAGEAVHMELADSGPGVDIETDREKIVAGFARLIVDAFAMGDGLKAEHAELLGGRARLGQGERHGGEIDSDISEVHLTGLHLEGQ